MSKEYFNLIKSWHIKASEEDYFSKFTFEYMAFIAFVRTQKYTEDGVRSKMSRPHNYKISDRDYIQTLKQEPTYKNSWVALLSSDLKLKEIVQEFHQYLLSRPLIVDDKWWDNGTYQAIRGRQASGAWRSEDDYENIIETWYKIRNNLFHGTKSPEVECDKKLVRYSYLTLSAFVESVLIRDFEKHRLYPFYGHEFMERFYEGKAEVTAKENGGGSWSTIYELVMMNEEYFPVIIEDQVFLRSNLVSILKGKLQSAHGSEQFDSLKAELVASAGENPDKIAILNDIISEL